MGMDIENIDTEWKESWSDKYLKTIAAFHNTHTGRLVIGRRDDGEYIGVQDIKGTTKSISDSIRNKLHIVSETRAEVIEGKECIIIDVPKGDKLVDYDGRFYMRVGNTTQQIEGDELKTILLKENGLEWLDQSTKLSLDDISPEAVSFFISRGKRSERIPDEVDDSDIESVLKRYGLIRDGEITLSGAFLFGKNPHDLDRGAFLKIGQFGPNREFYRDKIIYMPFILIPDKVQELLDESFAPPKQGFEDGSFAAVAMYDYPKDAVRELIVNALVHKDYHYHEPVTVSVYPDRLEVFNFGKLPEGVTESNLKGKHPSIRRNTSLSEVFFAAGYVENWAMGIQRIMDACKANGNPEPMFEEAFGGVTATLRIRSDKKKPAEPISSDNGLDEKDRAIIQCILQNSSSSKQEISDITSIPLSTVKYRVSKLTAAGFVRREGSNKKGFWVVDKDKL
ncbi:MAG: winged helix-turn-helix transcriptional regulator [Thermoplasmata archaeon]|nr:winged helix-turn-helix transcriptional regulator [Thermoplasmata archaeon]